MLSFRLSAFENGGCPPVGIYSYRDRGGGAVALLQRFFCFLPGKIRGLLFLCRNSANLALMITGAFDRILLVLLVCGAAVWLGGSMLRAQIFYDLFTPGTLNYHGNFDAAAELQSFRLVALSGSAVMSAYVVTALSALLLFIRKRSFWRGESWLFMSGVLFFLYMPVEIAQMIYDAELTRLWFPLWYDEAVTPTVALCRRLLLERLQFWNGYGGMLAALAGLAYLTSAVLLIWRPRPAAEADSAAE